jgi:hypothetical protein
MYVALEFQGRQRAFGGVLQMYDTCERRVGTNMQSTLRPARHARTQANAADTCKHC